MELGIASVAAITAIAYLLGMAVKATEAADKWIPIICGAAGLILGVVAWAMGVPDFPAHDWLNAAPNYLFFTSLAVLVSVTDR